MKHTNTGRFIPKNKKKYTGDIDNIIYRSSYELKMMDYLDTCSDVLEWSSESVVIPYTSPIDNKKRKYYVDFYAKILNKDGELEKYLFEVKPKKFTKPPKKRDTNAYIKEVKEFLKNQAKWESANNFCKKNNMKFQVITEGDLNF